MANGIVIAAKKNCEEKFWTEFEIFLSVKSFVRN